MPPSPDPFTLSRRDECPKGPKRDTMTSPLGPDSLWQPKQGGSIAILITATTVEQTGLNPGELLLLSACDGSAVCEWGAADATVADGGAAFAVPRNTSLIVRVPTGVTAINVIEANTASDGAAILLIAVLEQV